MPGSRHLAAEERGVGGFRRPDLHAEEEIGERGHAMAFAPKRRGKRGVGRSSAGSAMQRKEGGSSQARHGGKENGAQRPAAARERWRRALVGRCPVLCESRGAGSARGLCLRVWAGQGKEGAGLGPRVTVPIFYLK
jgi:hypothetical protein